MGCEWCKGAGVKKTHKDSVIKELTSVQLWELSDDKNSIVYQAEFTRFSESIGQSLFLVECGEK